MTDAEFIQIYNEFSDPIFRHCFFRVSSREVAMDLTQETFIKTWRAIEKGQQIENIKAFLYKVASNLIIDYYRKHKEVSLDDLKEKGLDFVREDSQGNKESVDFMDLQLVTKELQNLPEKYRHVVMLRYIEDMSPGEIADIVGASENSVSVRIHRGIQMLKQNLNVEESKDNE